MHSPAIFETSWAVLTTESFLPSHVVQQVIVLAGRLLWAKSKKVKHFLAFLQQSVKVFLGFLNWLWLLLSDQVVATRLGPSPTDLRSLKLALASSIKMFF